MIETKWKKCELNLCGLTILVHTYNPVTSTNWPEMVVGARLLESLAPLRLVLAPEAPLAQIQEEVPRPLWQHFLPTGPSHHSQPQGTPLGVEGRGGGRCGGGVCGCLDNRRRGRVLVEDGCRDAAEADLVARHLGRVVEVVCVNCMCGKMGEQEFGVKNWC